jgi:hypothetical protein
MVGLHTQKMIEESIQEYFKGNLTDEEAELNNFGNFIPYIQTTPIYLESLAKHSIVEISAGYSFTAAVTSTGLLFTW